MQYTSQQNDWLVQPFRQPASVEKTDNQLTLDNGLIQRTFVTSPNFATVDYTNQITGSSLLRGIKPEAVLTINGHQVFSTNSVADRISKRNIISNL